MQEMKSSYKNNDEKAVNGVNSTISKQTLLSKDNNN